MGSTTANSQRGAPANATIVSIVVAAVGTYRRRFGRIVLAAALVFAPIDLIVTLATRAAEDAAARTDVVSGFIGITGNAISVAGTTLSVIFFAGVVERIVSVDQHGHEDASMLRIVGSLPVVRLILLSLLATTLILTGLLLLVVPGLVLMVLFGIVGPVMVIEDRRVAATLCRSARLVWPHFILALVLILVPSLVEGALDAWVEELSVYEQTLPHLALDVALTIVVGGMVGVVEVTLAHTLIADRRRRDEDRPRSALERRAAPRPIQEEE